MAFPLKGQRVEVKLEAEDLKCLLSLPGMSNTSDVLARIAAPQLAEARSGQEVHHKGMYITNIYILFNIYIIHIYHISHIHLYISYIYTYRRSYSMLLLVAVL